MNTRATHICINSFNYNEDKPSQKSTLLFSTTCFGLKGHHKAETSKKYVYMGVCICVYTRSLYETDSFIVFNFQVETCR